MSHRTEVEAAMFGKRPEAVQPKRVDTIIGKDTQVTGRIVAAGTIRIDGRVEGEIETDSDVVVGEPGRVVASIHARNVTIAGEVQGNIHAEGRLEIVPSGKLYGDVKIAVLAIEDGAIFKGMCEMIMEDARPKLLPGKTAAPELPQGEDAGDE